MTKSSDEFAIYCDKVDSGWKECKRAPEFNLAFFNFFNFISFKIFYFSLDFSLFIIVMISTVSRQAKFFTWLSLGFVCLFVVVALLPCVFEHFPG